MKFHRIILSLIVFAAVAGHAADPTATNYTMKECEGSLRPYPAPASQAQYPDSLVPVFINHVGRHGARYPASSANCAKLAAALSRADSLGTITPLGRSLKALNERVIARSTNRWGALDSLGMSEQQGIAARMYFNYRPVFENGAVVQALSSYSPRAMMSMYSFTHQLDRMSNRITFTTSTGRINSGLMRPFDTVQSYLDFRRDKTWEPPYTEHFAKACPTTAIRRVLGEGYPFGNADEERDLAITEYYVVAGLRAMGMPSEMSTYFSTSEANALWSCFNLRQYLQRTATTISAIPADIASELVLNLVQTTDDFIAGQNAATTAVLRFGHAETLMPLLSLLKIPGCYYLTNYFDTVAQHWCDFDVVPMAANIQFVLFKAKRSGRYYMRIELNERPVQLRKGDNATIYPWGEVRRYMTDCVPLYAQ